MIVCGIEWRRREVLENDQHLCDGRWWVDDCGKTIEQDNFIGLSYPDIISAWSEWARRYTKAELIMQRVLLTGKKVQVVLDEKDQQQIRNCPADFIAATSPDKMIVHVRSKPAALTPVEGQPVKAGTDVMAAAFGDYVYLTVSTPMGHPNVECPGCGRNVSFTPSYIICDYGCMAQIPIVDVVPAVDGQCGRVKVATSALLYANYPRYFLPVAWNVSGPWIVRGSLRERYDNYLKEKVQCYKAIDQSE